MALDGYCCCSVVFAGKKHKLNIVFKLKISFVAILTNSNFPKASGNVCRDTKVVNNVR